MTTPIASYNAVSGFGDGAGAAVSAGKATTEAADRFLTLLVSQMRNQDPLNPLDNAQLTSQLAQISTVTGVDKLNQTVATLAASLSAGQSLQAVSLVGHLALVPGNKLELAGGTATGGFVLPASTDGVKMTITNAAGAVVRTIDLGTRPEGSGTATWDGKTDAGATAIDGTYTFSVAGTADGKAVTADTLIQGKVLGLVAGTTGMQLDLGRFGRFDLGQVVAIN